MAVYRAMAYGPSQGEYTHSTNYGHFGKLQQGDIAISPNLLDQFPFGTRVDAIDPKTGEVLRSGLRVADTSWITTGKPTSNSFEIWNDQDLGHAELVPSGGSSASSSATAAVSPTPTVAPSDTGMDPNLQDAIRRMQVAQALTNRPLAQPGLAGQRSPSQIGAQAGGQLAQIVQGLRQNNPYMFTSGAGAYRAGLTQADPFGAGGTFNVAA